MLSKPYGRFILSTVALTFAMSANGADWVHIPVYSKDHILTGYDRESVKVGEAYSGEKYLIVWTQTFYLSPQKLSDGKEYDYTKVQEYIACSSRKFYLGDVYWYTINKGLIDSHESRITKSISSWSNIVPDSVGEGMANHLCNEYKDYL